MEHLAYDNLEVTLTTYHFCQLSVIVFSWICVFVCVYIHVCVCMYVYLYRNELLLLLSFIFYLKISFNLFL